MDTRFGKCAAYACTKKKLRFELFCCCWMGDERIAMSITTCQRTYENALYFPIRKLSLALEAKGGEMESVRGEGKNAIGMES